MNINNNTIAASSAAPSGFAHQIGIIDEAITALQNSLEPSASPTHNPEEETMLVTQNACTAHSGVHPAPRADSAQSACKAFCNYMVQGEPALSGKSYALSRDAHHGGFFVPSHILDALDAQLKNLCPMRRLAKVDIIQGEYMELLLDGWTADAGWNKDGVLATPSTLELTQLRVPLHTLYARPKASQKLLDETGSSIEHWLVAKVAEKMAALENHAFLHGNGEEQPTGILHYPHVPLGQAAWGKLACVEQLSAVPEITRTSLLELAASLTPEYLSGAAWLVSRSALIGLQNLTDGHGRFLLQSSLALGMPATLLGYPVHVTDDLPALSEKETTIPILFGDFQRAYQIADGGAASVLRDPYSSKPFVEFYTTKRVGGDVVDFHAVRGLSVTVAA